MLRGGTKVATVPAAGVSRRELATMMVGHDFGAVAAPASAGGDVRLRVEDLHVTGDRGTPAVRGLSFEARSGEIVAIAGVSGNGQRDLAEAIAGLRPVSGGRIVLDWSRSPTRGIDVGSAQYIHQRLIDQRDAGTAVVVISEDLDEASSISDRILVMYEGHIVGEVDPRRTSRETIGLLMAGTTAQESTAAEGRG